MKQKNLFVMSGIPGSGKSTWIKENCPDATVISRDAIRYSLISDTDEYFAKENQVFKTFINQIQAAIDDQESDKDIYCDATHITKASRDKLFRALNLSNVKNITVVVVRPSLKESLRRNNLRTGRARVPEKAVIRMWTQFQRPEEDKDRIFDTLYVEVP